MAAPIVRIKRSSQAGKIPTNSQLFLGELAINTTDGKVYIEQERGGVGVGTTVIAVNPWNVGLGGDVYDINFTAGDVGVGTDNPTAKLDVNGTLNVSGVSTFQDNVIATSTLTVGVSANDATYPTDEGVLAVYTSGTKNALIIQTTDNSNSRGIAFRNSGDAYIGYISMEDRGSNLGDMVFGVSNATETSVSNVDQRLRITKDGYVGINSTAPTATLDVNGTLNVSGVSTFQGNVNLGDNDKIILGDGNDLQIFHNGSHSLINEVGTGNLYILASTQLALQKSGSSENYFVANADGSVELYYDASKKFETTGAGVNVTGIVTATTFQAPGGTYVSGSDTKDDVALVIDTDSAIYTEHGGQYLRTLIENQSSAINIGQSATSLIASVNLYPGSSGTTNLYHGGANKKLQTTTSGVDVTGTTDTDQLNVSGVSTFQSHIHLGDDDELRFGDSDDFKIYHASSGNSIIREIGPGSLKLWGTNINIENSDGSERYIDCNNNGAVELWYDNSKKFETTGIGVSIVGTGNTATITGPSNLVLDPSAVGDNTGTVTILGNLQVEGTQTIINSTTLEVDDKLVSIAKSATNASQADGAGLEINGASATLTYASTGDKWVFNKEPYYNTDRLLTTADEGSGNGLDADTVDGIEASSFLRSDAADTGTGLITLTNGLNVTGSNVGIGTDTPAYKLEVNGSFAATTKSFVIDHPTKEGMKLRYGSLEGPENGVYVRGRLKDNNTIELPDHWTGLVDEETITVNLTPIGRKALLHSVVDIVDNTVVVESANDVVDCFYTVFGERKDVEKLEVEF